MRFVVDASWFAMLRMFAGATLFVQLLLEFPKLGYMWAAASPDGVYTIFPPIPGQAVSGSPWWWLILHLLSASALSFAVHQLIWMTAAQRRTSSATWVFKLLTAFVTVSIVLNSNHFGPAPAMVGVVIQCTLILVVAAAVFFIGLQSDIALAVFMVVFSSANWFTFVKYTLAYGFQMTHHTSCGWTAFGTVWFFAAYNYPYFFTNSNNGKLIVPRTAAS